jgi:lysophospholipase L1-like esterase
MNKTWVGNKIRKLKTIILSILFVIFLITDVAGQDSPIRIGTFGDSITMGAGFNLATCGAAYTSLGSYRYYLIPMLEYANVPHDMVGLWGKTPGAAWVIGEEARVNDNNWMYPDTSDLDHTGWGGVASKALVDYLIQVGAAEQLFPKPNPVGSIAILHIGSNDAILHTLLGGPLVISVDEAIYNVARFIVYMTAHDPTIHLIICQIVPNHWQIDRSEWVDAFNLELKELVEEMSVTVNNLYLVDMNTPMRDIWQEMSDDTLHPNNDGYLLMASTLFSFLMDQGIMQITPDGIN